MGSASADLSGAAIQPLSPAGFGIGGLTTPPVTPTVPFPLAKAAPEGDTDLDAADLMTLRAMLSLLIEERARFASTDLTVKRQAAMELVRLFGYLTGFFDSKDAIKGTPPGDGFAGLFGPTAPPPLDVALDQLQTAISSLVTASPTRAPNMQKARDNIKGDTLIALGTGMVVAALAAILD